ncbi:DUF7220 family protein [Rhodobacter capsulatus]|uniref:DUF7220 family protein n=1 Tax=Rhodobacter capsulatus TaxID=1061 RepID=UPI004026777D
MKQSRAMSQVEAVANVVVGYGVAVVTLILIFPVFGLHTTLAQNLKMSCGCQRSAVSARSSPFALRLDYSRKFQGMSAAISLCMCWSRILRSVAAI